VSSLQGFFYNQVLIVTIENSIPQDGAYRESSSSSQDKLKSDQPAFDHKAQRLSLLKAGAVRLFITTLICVLLGVTIYSFDTLDHGMTTSERRGFNTVVIALSMTLSLILFHSLEWCAQVIRWRILASRFYTPREFNLVYDCDRKLSNLRLLWVARTPGRRWPNKIQLLVAFYLFISIALLVDTALLGLTYSVEVSSDYKMTKKGTISVANLTTISPIKNTLAAQYLQAQNYGLISQGFVPVETTYKADDPGPGGFLTIQYDIDALVFWYRFTDMSATNMRNYDMSDRYIVSNASCHEVKLLRGGYGGGVSSVATREETNGTTIQIQDGDGPVQELYIGELQAPGSITWLGSVDMGLGECGPRCAHIWALQSASSPPGTGKPRFWKCTNTISRMLHAGTQLDVSEYDMPDKLAQIMAGAIGLSGIWTADLPYQRVLYPDGNAFAPLANITTPDIMAGTIMWFSAGAFGAMDGFGPRRNITANDEPIAAQVVNVQWQFTIVVLVIPPLVQAILLVAVISYGNSTVVRDPSALSTARLLRPIIGDGLHDRKDIQLEKDTLGLSQSNKLRYRPYTQMEMANDERMFFVARTSPVL
jgi:hypothetical protein